MYIKPKSIENDEKVCMRCHGRKKVYKVLGVYSHIDTNGSQPIDCPMCLGSGKVKKLEEVMKDIEHHNKKTKNKKDIPVV